MCGYGHKWTTSSRVMMHVCSMLRCLALLLQIEGQDLHLFRAHTNCKHHLLFAAEDRDAEEDKFVLLDKAEAEEEEALR